MTRQKDHYEVIWDPDENPPYIWGTILQSDIVLARVKLKVEGDTAIVSFMTVEFHWRKKGIGRFAIQKLKQRYPKIIASYVKFPARAFWERLGFHPVENSRDYCWECQQLPQTPLQN